MKLSTLRRLERSSLISFLEGKRENLGQMVSWKIKMIKSRILLKTMTFDPVKFFCKKRDGHSKREREEIIDLHLSKTRFVG